MRLHVFVAKTTFWLAASSNDLQIHWFRCNLVAQYHSGSNQDTRHVWPTLNSNSVCGSMPMTRHIPIEPQTMTETPTHSATKWAPPSAHDVRVSVGVFCCVVVVLCSQRVKRKTRTNAIRESDADYQSGNVYVVLCCGHWNNFCSQFRFVSFACAVLTIFSF